MATIKDSVWLQERIEQEKRKQQVLEERRKQSANDPYQSRDTEIVLVPAIENFVEVFYEVPVPKETLTKVCGTIDDTGLLEIGCIMPGSLP